MTRNIRGGGVLAAALILSAGAHAQGILTVTPSRTTTTVAGTGTAGYTGDTGAATSATIALPGAVAYDAAGDIFIADTNNHVIREVSASGTITTVAGTGVEGYSGDNGPATSAQLDTPLGIAVDSSGNLYIADAHNHRIRKVSAAGTITTIAGTGIAGFSGDGAAATAAQLALPSGVAVDASGNVYIADTNNHRIREIASGTIITIAGDGEELYAGDGAAATAAALDSPTGVAVSSNGTVYVADRLNQRIRAFTIGGNITTVAGSGASSFAGGFSGDGASATAATLARPTGVSVDAAGNVYVADTDNQRIRQLVNGGVIATVIGSGATGFGADGGASTSAVLNTPKSVAPDANGNLAVADTLDHRIRNGALPTLSFGSVNVGVATAAQSITLANSGSASITVSNVALSSNNFTVVAGGSCSATPITLVAGASCTQSIAYVPLATGPASGSVVYSGTGVVPQKILLTGTATQAGTKVQLSSNLATPLNGQPVIFSVTVVPPGVVTPTGTVSFYDGTTLIAANVPLSGGAASLTTAALPDGTNSITAQYSGDTNYSSATSPAVGETVEDFQLAVSGVAVQSVIPGRSATFTGTLQSVTGPFGYPIVLSLTGLPTGAIATFNPPSVTLNGSPVAASVTIQTPATASVHFPFLFGGGTVTLAFLLLPFGRRMRRAAPKLRLIFAMCWILGLGSITMLTGCGSNSGLLGQQQETYTIGLVGTATGANGATLQHTVNYTLTVQ